MGELRKERAALAEATRAQNTRDAYLNGWLDFERWCSTAGRCAMPASSDTLSLYLVDLARVGRALATIQLRVAAIVDRHAAAGHKSPVDGDAREVLAGLRRRLGTAPRNAKAALSVEELRAMLSACPEEAGGLRDRALLLVGFAGGLRRSELSGLDLADVSFHRRGLVLALRRSKTDQEGAGREVGIHYGRRAATCPVRALKAWIRARGRWDGPLFVVADRRGGPGGSSAERVTQRRLSGEAIARAIKAAARRAGLDASHISGHSLRAGFATTAAELGAGDRAIMGRTGHRSAEMVGRYVRHGSLFSVDPLRGAL